MGKIFKALEKKEKESGRSASSALESQTFLKPVSLNSTGEEVDRIAVQKPQPIVPALEEESDKILIQKTYPLVAEEFRVLKNSLLFPDSGNPPRTIMVTSTTHGEGKSSVAAHLAVAIAYSIDDHVLLVDCDLHHPTVHSMLGLENDRGLSTYLTRDVSLPSLMKKTFLEKLTVLLGGPMPDNPSDLISSKLMKQLINEVATRYANRYIVLDAPPPLITPETNALAKNVDGILLVVKHGYTQKDRIQDIIDIYGKDKILGVVYNFAKDKFGLSYSSKYTYGYEK